MFTIKIIERSSGTPAYYKRVSIEFKGFFRGFSEDKRTDRNGEVHYSEDNARGTIYIDGQDYGEHELAGRVILYI